MLWSPVGAPAGVPGPRRNADDCDAGWFAPVATRRRAMLASLGPRRGLAALSGGRPPGTPRWDARPHHPSVAALVRGSRRGPWAAGLKVCLDIIVGWLSVRSSSVMRGSKAPGSPGNSHACPQIKRGNWPPGCRRVCRQRTRKLPAAVRAGGPTGRTQDPVPCPRDPGAGRAVGYLRAEPCRRPGNPPDGLISDRRPALCVRKARFAGKARLLLGTLYLVGGGRPLLRFYYFLVCT